MSANRIQPKSRKSEIFAAFREGGPDAARAVNATLAEPVKDNTLQTWFSTWRNAPATSAPKPKLTTDLRAAAIRLSGAVRIDKRAQLYRLPDNRTAMLQTNAKQGLMNPGGALFKQDADAVVIAIPREYRSLANGIEVYCIPMDVVRKALAKHREDWMATNPDTHGHNNLDVINFYQQPGWPTSGQNFATKWAKYRIGTTEADGLVEPTARTVDYPGYRIVSDEQIFSAPDFEGLVTLLRITARFSEIAPSNDAFMRDASSRASTVSGNKVRSGSAENFIRDLAAAGLIGLMKREIELVTP